MIQRRSSITRLGFLRWFRLKRPLIVPTRLNRSIIQTQGHNWKSRQLSEILMKIPTSCALISRRLTPMTTTLEYLLEPEQWCIYKLLHENLLANNTTTHVHGPATTSFVSSTIDHSITS